METTNSIFIKTKSMFEVSIIGGKNNRDEKVIKKNKGILWNDN